MRFVFIFIVCLFMALAVPASAQDLSAGDEALQTRLTSIYQSTDSLSGVTVAVENGVVTLSGEIANSELAKDAMEIAKTQDGTVYIQDQIDRTLVGDSDVGEALTGLQKDVSDITQALPIIGLALLVFAIFFWFGGVVANLQKFWRKIAPNPFLAELLSQTVRVLFIIIGLVVALNLLGAQAMIATILGGAGVVGIAIGFAVRDTLENYLASIMLSLRQPFRQGDHVLIGEHQGKVMRLTSRATIMMTLDGNHLRIPNATVFKAVILNYTTNPERRFSFALGVDAADDPVAAMKIGLDVMRANAFVLDKPGPGAIISEVGDSNIILKFTGWVDQTSADFGKARSYSIRGVKDKLEAEGFSLPEPIYRVKLENLAGTEFNTPSDQTPKPKSKKQVKELMVDVTPDTTIDAKLEEELSQADEDNLLDDSKPTE